MSFLSRWFDWWTEKFPYLSVNLAHALTNEPRNVHVSSFISYLEKHEEVEACELSLEKPADNLNKDEENDDDRDSDSEEDNRDEHVSEDFVDDDFDSERNCVYSQW